MANKFKKLLSLLLSVMMTITLLPGSLTESFAAGVDISVSEVYYTNTITNGKNTYTIKIIGDGFIQPIGKDGKDVTVVKDVNILSAAGQTSLMQGEAVKQGVKTEVTTSIITITGPETGDFNTLKVNAGGTNNFIINTSGIPNSTYRFNVDIGKIAEMESFQDNIKYSGKPLEILGRNFTGLTELSIGAAKQDIGSTPYTTSDTKISLTKLEANKFNELQSIRFVKESTGSKLTYAGGTHGDNIKVYTTSEVNSIIKILQPIEGLDNLLVVPNEGPYNKESMISVFAMDDKGKQLLENKFKKSYELTLRRMVDGKPQTIKLTGIELIYKDGKETNPVIGIKGWTTKGPHPFPSKWDMVVSEQGHPEAEAVKKEAYTISNNAPSPVIDGLLPSEGPNSGGTKVLITGKNIFTVNTPGLTRPTSDARITPSGDATAIDNNTLGVKYDVAGKGFKLGNKEITDISRQIKVRISSKTIAVAGKVYQSADTAGKIPSLGEVYDGKKYGDFHFTVNDRDGLVVITDVSSAFGPQDVVLEMETTFTLKTGSGTNDKIVITASEGTKYRPFTLIETTPIPQIDSIEVPYGYFNDTAERDINPLLEEGYVWPETDKDKPSGDGIEPLMIRITGQKFEVLREKEKDASGNLTGKEIVRYPEVKFLDKDDTELPALSSNGTLDTKVLDDKGNAIDGKFTTIGTTLVVSIVPRDTTKELRQLINEQQEQQGQFKNLEGKIVVKNPSGLANQADANGVKFQFRRPTEETGTDFIRTDANQPIIKLVTSGGAPIKRLPSDTDSNIQIKLETKSGSFSDLKKLMVTVDGKNISDKIKKAEFVGTQAVLDVVVPKGFIGKTRLQVITPEGLMDSYTVTFDTAKGPEIKELIPSEGDKGTFVVIKRDTKANEVGFKPSVFTANNIEEQKGSVVLWNGVDINELLDGYTKDSAENLVAANKEDSLFLDYKQAEKGVVEKARTFGKYVYVVDADTIYLKIPDEDMLNAINKDLKEGTYGIQIKNPDGAESSIAKPFKIIDVIDKTKIGSIEPNTDDKNGGLVVTIKAGGDTNFKGGVDVYFGSQKAEVVGYDINNKEVYVKVPPLVDYKFPTTLDDTVQSFTVPVTLQNKVNKSTDTKLDGFIYLNPNYTLEITQIYNSKYATDPKNAEAKKGVEGDTVVIRGKNLRLEQKDGKYILPRVFFGYTLADTDPVSFGARNVNPDGSPILKNGRAELEWIKVKVPKKPTLAINSDGSVDVLVQNPDGAKDIAEKGFIYSTSKPTINEKASVLTASRFHDTVTVSAKDVNEKGLLIAFGDKTYEKELSSSEMELETTKQVEKIVVKYTPGVKDNISVYYKAPDGTLTLMTDTDGDLIGGKGSLGKIGDSLVFGINWKNPAYHSTEITKNPELIASLNREYVLIKSQSKAPDVNTLIIRRGLGKLESFSKNPATAESKLTIATPYNEKIEKTTITLINSDGSSATAPFIFHGGMQPPVITDIDGSKERDITVQGNKSVKAKVFTNDYTTDSEITLIGSGFKDIEKVKVGDLDAEVINISSDYTKVKIKVPKGTLELVGKPLPITMVTKGGNAYSDKSNPPVYYMMIQAGSKPELSSISPAKGPQTGGTKVTINGAGFRDIDEFGSKGEIKVFFAGKEGKVTKLLKDDKGEIVGIQALSPAVDMIDEKSTVYVKNADEGKSEPIDFQYVSQPVIEKLEGTFRLDAEKLDDAQDVKVTVIGKNFYNPEKVIIGGKLLKVDKNKDAQENQMMLGVKDDGANQYVELQKDKNGVENGIAVTKIEKPQPKGAKPAANEKAKEKNTTSFVVTMPIITYEQMQSMTSKSIIVVDQDGGTSPEKPADIKLPVPQAPKLIAVPGYNGSIGLSWSYKPTDPNRATRFEVYAKESGKGDYVHVGDVVGDINKTDYSYIIKDLKPDTEYQVKLRVMNKFGEAEDFGYAKVRTLRPEDDPKAKEQIKEMQRSQDNVRQNGTQKMVGDQLQYTVGTTEKVIDLSKYTANKKQVRIPVSQIKLAPNTTIQVIDKGMSMSVPFNAFTLNQVNSATDHAVVAIDFVTGDNKQNTTVTRAIPKNKQRASEVYKINFAVVEPKKKYPISFTNAPLALALTANQSGYTVFAQYDEKTGKIVQNANKNIKNGGYYVLLKNK